MTLTWEAVAGLTILVTALLAVNTFITSALIDSKLKELDNVYKRKSECDLIHEETRRRFESLESEK